MGVVAILANPANRGAARLCEDAARWLHMRGHEVRSLLCEPPKRKEEEGGADVVSGASLEGVDLALSLGGDGTFLRMVPLAHAFDVPLLGVNFGHLGYLLPVQPAGVEAALERALSGDVELEERAVLKVRVEGEAPIGDARPEADQGELLALNELVIERSYPGHTVR
ncbi:MAG: NAD(+)/NADH kinase, partial [Acidimicrobiales bacterium]